MASFVDKVTERDLPRSRNTLDESEEEAARRHRAEVGEPQLQLVWNNAKDHQGFSKIIVTGCKELEAFVQCCFEVEEGLGGIYVDETCVGEVAGVKGGEWLVVSCGPLLEESQLFDAAEIIVSELCEVKSLVVLEFLRSTDYVDAKGERRDPPLVRAIGANADSVELCKKMNLELLESNNIITGISAAVLSQSLFSSTMETSVGLFTLKEPHLEEDTLVALVDPFLAATGTPKPAEDARASIIVKCAKITEKRNADREMLYI